MKNILAIRRQIEFNNNENEQLSDGDTIYLLDEGGGKMKRNLKAYKQTSVHWGKSQADISKLLSQYGIQDTRFTFMQSRNEVILEFNYPTEIDNKSVSIGVRILVPVPEDKDMEKAKNQIHRALFYYLKSKFEALSFGLVEFMQEFMPHLLINSKDGQITLYQIISPQYQKGLISGQQGEIKMIESSNKSKES